ncbi:hypothetical protein F4779DRAFT_636457 [Xylariaceae sp. FL0662B]|nr:hypothetical protein F4779DRAFT_636457 [Xylariaceae sp. FL0662B]
MGGLAFASGENPLYTPRMPATVYNEVRDRCHAKLRELFVVVATPIPGPAKTDYGDIDIFMTWERQILFPCSSTTTTAINNENHQHQPQDLLEAAAQLLKAERTKREQPGVMTLAIPWPDDLLPFDEEYEDAQAANGDNSSGSIAINVATPPPTRQPRQRFIQVDAHLSQSLEQLQWMLFKQAHGDLWNILGSTIRPFGLTVDGTGLHVRIPEIEARNRRQARVLLTADPAAVLAFLDLDAAGGQWQEPFATADAVFEYAASCRLFWVRPEEEENQDGASGDGDGEEQTGGAIGRESLKSNDRRRMNQRPLFRRWMEEFLPGCRARGRFVQPRDGATRDSVREEALARFVGARREYEARVRAWRRQRQRETLWRDVIKGSIPDTPVVDPFWRGCCAAALKKIVLDDDPSFGFLPSLPFRDDDGMFVESRVRMFVERAWKQVGDVAWQRNQERFAAKMAKKGAHRSVSDNEESDADVGVADAKQKGV